jgi:predicted nucleotide-binding protein
MTPRPGDLVITEDGYYGIVLNDSTVLLANGLDAVYDVSDLAGLTVCRIKAGEKTGAAASFMELLRG